MPNSNFMSDANATAIFTAYATAIKLGLKAWVGTTAEWDQLTDAQKKQYQVNFKTDDVYPATLPTAANTIFDDTVAQLGEDRVQGAIEAILRNFLAGVDDVYDAIVAKGTTPASHSLADVIQGIEDIETGITPSGTLSITTNGTKDVTNYASANVQVPASAVVSGTLSITTNGTKDVTNYASANVQVPASAVVSGTKSITANGTVDVTSYKNASVAVPNSNSGTYTYGSGSTGGTVDLGAANSYRYVNADNVYAKGKADCSASYVNWNHTTGNGSAKSCSVSVTSGIKVIAIAVGIQKFGNQSDVAPTGISGISGSALFGPDKLRYSGGDGPSMNIYVLAGTTNSTSITASFSAGYGTENGFGSLVVLKLS